MPCEGLFSFAYHIMSANLGGFQTPAIMIIFLSQVSLPYCSEVAPPILGYAS